MFCGTTKKLTWKSKQAFFVGLPGLEPGTTGPESAVLPLHHSPSFSLLRMQRYKDFKNSQ